MASRGGGCFERCDSSGIALGVRAQEENGVRGAVAGQDLSVPVEYVTAGSLDPLLGDTIVFRLLAVVGKESDLQLEESHEDDCKQYAYDGEQAVEFAVPFLVNCGIHGYRGRCLCLKRRP